MHGNIGEWISDWYGNYDLATVQDPSGSLTGTKRVKRGGSYVSFARHIRAAVRIGSESYNRKSWVGFRIAFQQINTPPTDLNATTPLTIAENQPIGTVVGEFNATDPDSNATLTYHLVSGAGDGNNSLFSMDDNGTLRTATTFDYESNASTYSIRVQTKDEHNATVARSFSVQLTNLNEPVTGFVALSGTPVIGETLTATNTLTDPDGLGQITYYWYRDGSPVLTGGTFGAAYAGGNQLDGVRDLVFSTDGKFAYASVEYSHELSWFEVNATTGSLSLLGSSMEDGVAGVDGLKRVWNLILSPDEKQIYATGSMDDSIAWFDRNASTGAVTFSGILKNGQGGAGFLDGAKGLTLSNDGGFLYVASSVDAAVNWYDRNSTTGDLSYLGSLRNGVGGIDKLMGAQDVAFSPDSIHLYVVSYEEDSLSWFERNATSGALNFLGRVEDGVSGVDGMDGPSSLAVSGDGKHLYVTGNQEHAVAVFERNISDGSLTFIESLRDGVDADGIRAASDLTLSVDGKYLYIAGAWDNAVGWFERNSTTGTLSYLGFISKESPGLPGIGGARSASISPSGDTLYVPGGSDDAIAWFVRDQGTGGLSYVQSGSTYNLRYNRPKFRYIGFCKLYRLWRV